MHIDYLFRKPGLIVKREEKCGGCHTKLEHNIENKSILLVWVKQESKARAS